MRENDCLQSSPEYLLPVREALRRKIAPTGGCLQYIYFLAMKYCCAKSTACGLIILLLTGCYPPPPTQGEVAKKWETIRQELHESFPDVHHISPEHLHIWLASKEHISPLLLDIRSEEEYKISHLRNSRFIAYGKTHIETFMRDIRKDTPLVTYCSIGFRSAEVARKLQQLGYKQVYNLEGSIFAWVNEGRKVVRNGKTVKEVHPFNRRWGRLLNPAYYPQDWQ